MNDKTESERAIDWLKKSISDERNILKDAREDGNEEWGFEHIKSVKLAITALNNQLEVERLKEESANRLTQRNSMLTSEDGQGMVEYGLLIGLIAIVVIGALVLLGPSISDMFSGAQTAMESAVA